MRAVLLLQCPDTSGIVATVGIANSARTAIRSPSTRDRRRKEFQKYKELTGILHRAGVPLLAGTDSPEPYCPPGFSLHLELELLVESGLTPGAALRAATWNNAQTLGEKDRLGAIVAGAQRVTKTMLDAAAKAVARQADPTSPGAGLPRGLRRSTLQNPRSGKPSSIPRRGGFSAFWPGSIRDRLEYDPARGPRAPRRAAWGVRGTPACRRAA